MTKIASRPAVLSLPRKNVRATPSPPAPSTRLLDIFHARWPLAFPEKPTPLAVGTFQEIVARAPDLDAVEISAALAFYTNSAAYLAGFALGRHRVDLDGARRGRLVRREVEYARYMQRRLRKLAVRP